jgi:hypothetical protein
MPDRRILNFETAAQKNDSPLKQKRTPQATGQAINGTCPQGISGLNSPFLILQH